MRVNVQVNKIIYVLLIISSSVFAGTDEQRLLEGCKQLVSLHKNKTDQRVIMEFVMSPSDTLLAGYCRGMVESFVRYSTTKFYRCGYSNQRICEEKRCSKTDWYSVAKEISSIASLKSVEDLNGDNRTDVEDILIQGCN
ncbi:hypothetical protein CN03_15415 [Thalassolituus oleivorans]|nr:hypothetical protein CN03_15415 [Thalassolituus oleivorans]